MPLVIQLAGTSGAGKSTVVRRILDLATAREAQHVTARKAPMGYRVTLPGVAKTVFVVGAYEAPTGGCDTIKDVVRVVTLVEEHWRQGCAVIFEGLFVMNHTRGPVLARAVGMENFHLVRLTTPLETCFERINARRAVEGRGPLVDRHNNTEGNNTRAVNYCSKMGFMGVRVHRVSSDDAVALVLGLLRAPMAEVTDDAR